MVLSNFRILSVTNVKKTVVNSNIKSLTFGYIPDFSNTKVRVKKATHKEKNKNQRKNTFSFLNRLGINAGIHIGIIVKNPAKKPKAQENNSSEIVIFSG